MNTLFYAKLMTAITVVSFVQSRQHCFSYQEKTKTPPFSVKETTRLFICDKLRAPRLIASSLINKTQMQQLSSSRVAQKLTDYILLKENRSLVMFTTFLTILSLGLNFLSPYLLSCTIQLLSSQEQVHTFNGIRINLQSSIIISIASYVISQILLNNRDQLMVSISVNTAKKLLHDLVRHILTKDLSYYVNQPDSDKIYLIQKGFYLGSVGTKLLTSFIPIMIEMILTCILLSKKYGKEMGGLMCLLIGVYLFYGIKSSSQIVFDRNQFIIATGGIWEQFGNAISKYKIMRDYGQLDMTISAVDAALNKMAQADRRMQATVLNIGLYQQIVSSIIMLMITVYVGVNTKSGRFSVKDFILIVNYFLHLTHLLPIFGQSFSQLIAVYPDLNFVFYQLSQADQGIDLYAHIPLKIVPEAGATIEFRDVDFGYPANQNRGGRKFQTNFLRS